MDDIAQTLGYVCAATILIHIVVSTIQVIRERKTRNQSNSAHPNTSTIYNQPSEVVIDASMLSGETRDVQLSGESSQGQQSSSTTPDTNDREEYSIEEVICKNKPLTNSHNRQIIEQFTCNFCKQRFWEHGAILQHDPEPGCLCMCQTCCESGVRPKICPRCNCKVVEVLPYILSPMTCST